LALCPATEIKAQHLPSRIRQPQDGVNLKENVLEGQVPFDEAEKVFETDLILKALKKTNYVQTRAAELLGISRRILKYKMDKLGINDTPPDQTN
jgi:DNA-binding NtrC family response regulator